MADQGMDELDKMMAELAAAPKPAPAKPTDRRAPAAAKHAGKPAKVIDGFDESGQLVLDGGERDLPPRALEFVNRLKTFQMRVADPCTKERLNRQLAASSDDYPGTTSYYEERPQLAAYTINSEITRMQYKVVPPSGGAAVTDVDEIRKIFAACCPPGADAEAESEEGREGKGDKERGEGGEADGKVHLVWRLANQSLLAGLMQQLQDTFGQPEDVELCISIHNTASSFEMDLHEPRVCATTEFKVATVGTGDQAMLPLASLTGEILVDVYRGSIKQVVRDIRLLMVFDDDLEAAARSLAEGEARGGVRDSPAKGASMAALRDGMMTYTSSAASTAKVVGGGLVSSAFSTGSSLLSGLGSMVRNASGLSAGDASPSSPSDRIQLYNR